MITTAVLTHAGVIAASMLVALALIDMIHEHTARRWTRAVADFVVLVGFEMLVAFAFGGTSAVVAMLTH